MYFDHVDCWDSDCSKNLCEYFGYLSATCVSRSLKFINVGQSKKYIWDSPSLDWDDLGTSDMGV